MIAWKLKLKKGAAFAQSVGRTHRRDIAVFAVFLVAASTAYFLRQEEMKLLAPRESFSIEEAEIVSGNRNARQVIFTFDGGSGAQSGEAILATLKKHGAIGTFFLTGKFAEENPELVKRIAREGHGIFNHTYSHTDLPNNYDEEIKNELLRADEAIRTVTGKTTKPYFRPPYGGRDGRVLKVAADAGYTSVYWTTDALDWKESEGFTAEEARARIFSNLRPGALYLMHIGDAITGKILDEAFLQIKAEGYAIRSLTQGI